MFAAKLLTQLTNVGWEIGQRRDHDRLDFTWMATVNSQRYTNFLASCQAQRRLADQITHLESKQSICQDGQFATICLDTFMSHLRWHPQKHLPLNERGDPTKTDVYKV
jgi:hypothetical protein